MSCGYFLTDTLILVFLCGATDKLSHQILFHHGVSLLGISCALVSGYAFPAIISLMCMAEISTIFLNYRMLIPKEKQNNPIPMCNQITFAVSFTILRMIGFPYIVYLLIYSTSVVWSSVTWVKDIAVVVTLTMVLFMVILNFYWYLLILKGVRKLIQGIGKTSTDEQDKDMIDDYGS